MYDSRVLWSGDMCMTLSEHTSTLPRLVVQGHGFEASFLRWARLEKPLQSRHFLTEAMKYDQASKIKSPTKIFTLKIPYKIYIYSHTQKIPYKESKLLWPMGN